MCDFYEGRVVAFARPHRSTTTSGINFSEPFEIALRLRECAATSGFAETFACEAQ